MGWSACTLPPELWRTLTLRLRPKGVLDLEFRLGKKQLGLGSHSQTDRLNSMDYSFCLCATMNKEIGCYRSERNLLTGPTIPCWFLPTPLPSFHPILWRSLKPMLLASIGFAKDAFLASIALSCAESEPKMALFLLSSCASMVLFHAD